jgi:hypothetical protein
MLESRHAELVSASIEAAISGGMTISFKTGGFQLSWNDGFFTWQQSNRKRPQLIRARRRLDGS